MKRQFSILLVALLILTMALSLFGCGKKSEGTSTSKQNKAVEMGDVASNYNAMQKGPNGTSEQKEEPKDKVNSVSSPISAPPTPDTNLLGDQKIIFNATLTLEVDDFDSKFKTIESYGDKSRGIGYLQNSTHRFDKGMNRKEGTIVLRIPQNNFERIKNEIGSIGTIIEENVSTENITDQYYDTKYRARMYEAERDRVMEYLKKADTLDTMLQLERKLSEITYEIEKLNGTLRQWDNLVQFSTITVTLREKTADSLPNNSHSYWSRLYNTFIYSFKNAISGLGNFILGFVAVLPTLLLLGLLAYIGKLISDKYFKKKRSQNRDDSM